MAKPPSQVSLAFFGAFALDLLAKQ